MNATSFKFSIALIILLLVVPANDFVPTWTRTGSFNINDSGTSTKSIESTAGNIVVVQFSSEYALDFFVVHSDFYNLAGLPDISQCQFHICARSASYQFTVDRSGTWYLVFANSPQQQSGTWAWNEYSVADWNFLQFRNWTILVICVTIVSIFIVQYIRPRLSKKE